MNSSAKEALLRLSGELAQLSQDLERPPDTLEQLKFVLQKIADIRDISVEVEMQYRDIQVPCVSLCPQGVLRCRTAGGQVVCEWHKWHNSGLSIFRHIDWCVET